MAEFSAQDLLDEFALWSAALIHNPKNVAARAALKRTHKTWRAWKARGRTRSLEDLAAEADAEAQATPGYRADVER